MRLDPVFSKVTSSSEILKALGIRIESFQGGQHSLGLDQVCLRDMPPLHVRASHAISPSVCEPPSRVPLPEGPQHSVGPGIRLPATRT